MKRHNQQRLPSLHKRIKAKVRDGINRAKQAAVRAISKWNRPAYTQYATAFFSGVVRPSTCDIEHKKMRKQNKRVAHQGYQECARRANNSGEG